MKRHLFCLMWKLLMWNHLFPIIFKYEPFLKGFHILGLLFFHCWYLLSITLKTISYNFKYYNVICNLMSSCEEMLEFPSNNCWLYQFHLPTFFSYCEVCLIFLYHFSFPWAQPFFGRNVSFLNVLGNWFLPCMVYPYHWCFCNYWMT